MSRQTKQERRQGSSRGAGVDLALVLGMGVSTVLAIVTSLSISTSVVLGLLVGLVGATTTLQIDTLLRLEKRFNADDSRIMLLREIERAPELLASLTAIAKAAADAIEQHTDHQEFTEAARDTIATARAQLVGLADGRMVVEDGNTRWMKTRLQECQSSVLATSVDGDLGWWLSPSGQGYLAVNAELVTRKVYVQRIFLATHQGPALREVLDAQVAAGVDVLVLNPATSIPPALMRNFAIYDESYLVEDEVNALGVVTGYLHSRNPSDVNGAVRAFERLRTLSQPYVAGQVAPAIQAPVTVTPTLGP